MKKFIPVFWVLITLSLSCNALAEYRAITEIKAYMYPPRSNNTSKVIYTYKKGDVLKLQYRVCASSTCQVITPNGKKGWIYEYQITDEADLNKAYEAYIKAGFEQWDTVDLAVWSSVKKNKNKLDCCALKLAHKLNFNRHTDWPAFCNTFENTIQVQNRVSEIKALTKKLSLSPDRLNKVKHGIIWIGASVDHVLISWGTPVDINTTINASGKREQWVYRGGNYIYITNGIVSGIQN